MMRKPPGTGAKNCTVKRSPFNQVALVKPENWYTCPFWSGMIGTLLVMTCTIVAPPEIEPLVEATCKLCCA